MAIKARELVVFVSSPPLSHFGEHPASVFWSNFCLITSSKTISTLCCWKESAGEGWWSLLPSKIILQMLSQEFRRWGSKRYITCSLIVQNLWKIGSHKLIQLENHVTNWLIFLGITSFVGSTACLDMPSEITTLTLDFRLHRYSPKVLVWTLVQHQISEYHEESRVLHDLPWQHMTIISSKPELPWTLKSEASTAKVAGTCFVPVYVSRFGVTKSWKKEQAAYRIVLCWAFIFLELHFHTSKMQSYKSTKMFQKNNANKVCNPRVAIAIFPSMLLELK